MWAAQALTKARHGGMDEYARRMHHAYARYVAHWMTYYTVEQRWPNSPFWRRRHLALEKLLQQQRTRPFQGDER